VFFLIIVTVSSYQYYVLGCSDPGRIVPDTMDDLIRPIDLRLKKLKVKFETSANLNTSNSTTEMREEHLNFKLKRKKTNTSNLMNTEVEISGSDTIHPSQATFNDNPTIEEKSDTDWPKARVFGFKKASISMGAGKNELSCNSTTTSSLPLPHSSSALSQPYPTQSLPHSTCSPHFIDESEKLSYLTSLSLLYPLPVTFCSKCNIDQPARCKHCKQCGVCIATFDHHCVWIGNCVGEKNRRLFIVYLFVQVLELTLAGILPLCATAQPHSDIWKVLDKAALLVASWSMAVAVGWLTKYHVRFCMNGETTCKHSVTLSGEFMRGDCISYLDDFDLSKGNPFDFGEKENIKLYMNPPKKQFYLWEGKRDNLKRSQ